jgi:hypothetical protein
MKPAVHQIVAISTALAALAAPAIAQTIIHDPDPAIVEIKVEMQEIAVLSVIEGSASTIMDDANPTFVGTTNPLGPLTGMAQLELATNFCVGLRFDFPTTVGIRPHPIEHYGQALGLVNDNTLGVMPFFHVGNWTGIFGGSTPLSGSASNAPMTLSAGTGNLCKGYYDIFLGLVTQWDLTLIGEPMFAEPDTYRIPITVTLVP